MLRIGIDLGGTKTEGIVMDEAGRIILRGNDRTKDSVIMRELLFEAFLALVECGGHAALFLAVAGPRA